MQLESKWKRNEDSNTYWNSELKKQGYRKDKSVEREDSPLKKFLIAGAIAAGGIGAYKSGLLKGSIAKSIEYAGNYKAVAPTVTKTFRSWLKEGSEETMGSSLVRSKGIKDAFNKLSGKGNDDVVDRTFQDFKDLKDAVSRNVKKTIEDHNNDVKESFSKSQLLYDIASANSVTKAYKYTNQKNKAKEIMYADIVRSATQTSEQAATRINRTGYRAATLGDLVEIDNDTLGKTRLFSKDAEHQLDDDTLGRINKFINETKAYDSDGNKVTNELGKHLSLAESGSYKNLVLDDNILISEAGKISDLRNASKTGSAFVRSMATDFKIPFVGLNPLKFLGLDKAGIKDSRFGTLSMETAQPTITGKTGMVKMKDVVDEFGSSEVLVSDGKGFKFDETKNNFVMFRDDLELLKLSKGKYGISKEANELRKMANLKTREYEKFNENDNVIRRGLGKVGEKLDIGYQDSTPRDFDEDTYSGILSSLDPSTYIQKAFKSVLDKKIFNKGHGEVTDIGEVFGHHSARETANEALYVAIKKRIKFKEALDPHNNESIVRYFSQFLKGRDDLKEVNRGSLTLYHLFERMNQALNPFGLALSPDSTGTTADTIKNLIVKRFLPVYAGIQGLEYLNYLTEDEETGDNIEKNTAKAVAGLDITAHKVKDAFGITDALKKLDNLTYGNDHIGELPVVNKLGATRTAEEQAEYYRTGMDPVRKGRYWTLGNTPFTGSKIQYYKPNWYRETMADAEFSEVKYGSRKEYFENAWFPTPTSPLAPFRHFITDRYHYEQKHYYDRPYLLTSPQFEGVPIFGPILSATAGKVIKPQMRMHEEYWGSEQPKTTSESVNSYAVPYAENATDGDVNILKGVRHAPVLSTPDGKTLGNISTITPRYNKEQIATLGAMPKEASDGKEIYTTSSGQQTIVDINRRKMAEVNEQLGTMSIKKIIGASDRASAITPQDTSSGAVVYGAGNGEQQEDVPFSAINPNGFKATFGNQYKDTANVLGIYGFMASSFVTGNIGEGQETIETSGYAYSFRDKFWEQELGGLGGDLSEIFRRFVQKKRTDVDYYNPIRNTMPEWMPGENYFTDFKHGDPYQKVSKGELRLPGTPYETVWGIHDPLEMRIGSSSLGKSKDDIVNHLLRNDIITDEDALDIVQGGTKMHEKVEKEWLNSGFAIDIEGKIEDKENGIIGFYDARVHDATSKTGEAIVDIKTINDKGFRKVVEDGKAKDSHQKQVNYYLWATGNDKGYVHYINRDTGEKHTVGFGYDENMLQESLSTLNEARNEIREKIDNRELSRADLYKPIDRYRILADVAPYSEEFKNMKAILSRSGLRENDKKEYDAINERVQAQKQANRIYEYRFKTANVDTVKTNISKVDGESIYVNFNGEERKINFSGIAAAVGETAEERALIDSKKDEIKKRLVEGASVTLKVDHDELARDKTKGIKAVVYDSKGKNINRLLVREGAALQDEDDWSPTAIHARFNASERAFGSIWETVAHSNTYLNTKFLQVRSAQEDYERREVYGKNFASWDNPIQDYLMPSMYSAINRPAGVVVGALVGSWMGGSPFGRVFGAVAGASAVLIGKAYKAGYEAKHDEKWIPETRRKERDLNEYVDVLKFVKNQRLYNEYKDKAMREDNFNVDAYVSGKKKQANERKQSVSELEEKKAIVKEKYDNAKSKRDEFKEDAEVRPKREYGETTKEDKKLQAKYQRKRKAYAKKKDKLESEASELRQELVDINSNINEEATFREVEVLPENALKALEYRQAAEKTMYGYDPGEPLTNILSALPKKDRDRMKYFLKAPEEERGKILEIAPKYLRRPLQSAWGMQVDSKPSLDTYFQEHQLPGQDWAGWDENVDLDSIKVKMVDAEGLSNSEFNIWDDDVDKANSLGPIPLPSINFRSNAVDIRKRLLGVMGDFGIDNADITFDYSGSGMNIDMQIEHTKEREVENRINKVNFMR